MQTENRLWLIAGRKTQEMKMQNQKFNKIKEYQYVLIYIFITAFAMPTYAAPSVSGLVGTVNHGNSITISGTGFGEKNPVAPLKWDPVDGMYGNIIENTEVPVGGSNPWSSLAASSMNQATFTYLNPRGKFLAKYSNRTTLNNGGNGVVGHVNFPSAAGKPLYISWWLSGDSSTSRMETTSSFKFFRVTNDGGWGNEPGPGGVVWSPNLFNDYDWSTGFHIVYWASWTGIQNSWNRNEIIIDNTSNPKPRLVATVNNSLLADLVSSNGGPGCSSGGCTYGSLASDMTGIYTIGADWSNWTDSGSNPNHYTELAPRLDFGEIYVDNTLSRVEICNAATKATSNHCEIQIPQNIWNDGQIQIKVNQGSFADNSVVYLYVVDENGEVNETGYPIIFGSSGGDMTAPSSPSGLSVN